VCAQGADATTSGSLVAPSGLVATASSSSTIDLSWLDTNSRESGLWVERSPDGSAFTAVARLASNSQSYRDTGSSEHKVLLTRAGLPAHGSLSLLQRGQRDHGSSGHDDDLLDHDHAAPGRCASPIVIPSGGAPVAGTTSGTGTLSANVWLFAWFAGEGVRMDAWCVRQAPRSRRVERDELRHGSLHEEWRLPVRRGSGVQR